MNEFELDKKISKAFPPECVVRKASVRQIRAEIKHVPEYVPEYVVESLLMQAGAPVYDPGDPGDLGAAIRHVQETLSRSYAQHQETGFVFSNAVGRVRVTPSPGTQDGSYEAEFSRLGLKKIVVDAAFVQRHPRLRGVGMWGVVDLKHEFRAEQNTNVWLLTDFKPLQSPKFDFEAYTSARRQFTTEAWIDLLLHSVGFDPRWFNRRGALLQLIRLVPFCESGSRMLESGPAETHARPFYKGFSPYGFLAPSDDRAHAEASSESWDCIAWDATPDAPGDLPIDTSVVFIGTTRHNVPFMLKHTHLLEGLSESFQTTEFLDSLHFYLPGWELGRPQESMCSNGCGLATNYLAQALHGLRSRNEAERYRSYFSLASDMSDQDRLSIHKTFSGLMKIVFPDGKASRAEMEELLRCAIEGRKRVSTQTLRANNAHGPYEATHFAYSGAAGRDKEAHAANPFLRHQRKLLLRDVARAGSETGSVAGSVRPASDAEKRKTVALLEEVLYPETYHRRPSALDDAVEAQLQARGSGHEGDSQNAHENGQENADGPSRATRRVLGTPGGQTEEANQDAAAPAPALPAELPEGHYNIRENTKGVSYDNLLGPYLEGATKITVTDPYIIFFYQIRNLMELLEIVIKRKKPNQEVAVHLVTRANEDGMKSDKQVETLEKIQESGREEGLHFTWAFGIRTAIHGRSIETDHGWTIVLDRGLDIFKKYEMNDAFVFTNRLQQVRLCKSFYISFIKKDKKKN